MGYNRIDPRLWESGSFIRLSRVPCSGQSLWLFLLTCPQRHSSGIFRLGRGTIEDTTGWERKPLGKAFGELFAERMVEADWEANIVRFVNAANHYAPDNRNVAFAWVKYLISLPAVPIVITHSIQLKPLLERFGIPLPEPLGKPIPEPIPKPMGYSPSLPLPPSPSPSPEDSLKARATAGVSYSDDFETFWKAYPKNGTESKADAWVEWKAIKVPRPSLDVILQALKSQQQTRQWIEDNGKYIPHPKKWVKGRLWESRPSPDNQPRSQSGLALPPLTGV